MFNGKELQSEGGLSLYNYGARMYDVSIGRWGVVDLLTESAFDWTGYRYGFNNPIVFTDPNGMFEWYQDIDGNLHYDESIKSQTDLNKKGISGTFLGSKGVSINENTGDLVNYNSDGTISAGLNILNGVEVSAGLREGHADMLRAGNVMNQYNGAKEQVAMATIGVPLSIIASGQILTSNLTSFAIKGSIDIANQLLFNDYKSLDFGDVLLSGVSNPLMGSLLGSAFDITAESGFSTLGSGKNLDMVGIDLLFGIGSKSFGKGLIKNTGIKNSTFSKSEVELFENLVNTPIKTMNSGTKKYYKKRYK